MKVSVVMATYNGEKYIEKQLDSIIGQSRKPDEIVIADDCSKDKTIEIINNYADQHHDISWVINRNDCNSGYIKNFLSAINASSGEIIVLSDQDDIWSNDKISIIEQYFERYQDMISLHMDYSIIDTNGKIVREREIKYKKSIQKVTIDKFLKRLNYCGMSSSFRRDIMNYINLIDVNKLPTHDWTIHAIAVLMEGMYVSNKVVSFRRAHGDNVALKLDEKTKRNGIKQRLETVQNYRDYFSLLEEMNSITKGKYNETIKKYIMLQDFRKDYLVNCNILKWVNGVRYLRYYSSVRAYFCDLLYICKIF